jgi:predicted RNA-binding protein with PIN domain
MPYLIDGHNLIGKLPGISLSEMDDEQALIEMLQAFCQRVGKDADVYFDASSSGHGHARAHGRVTARYVRSGESADQAISRHLKRLGNEAANWTVVSSDNQVQNAAKRARARVIGADEFSRQLGSGGDSDKSSERKLSDDEIDDWLELFGEGGSS